MNESESSPPSALRARLDSLVGNPVQFRAVLATVLTGAWFFAYYQPTVGRIDELRRRVETERKRLALAEQTEDLREQTGRFLGRIPKAVDPDEAVQYLLEGVRSHPLKLTSLEPKPSEEVGPYKALVAALSVEGEYNDLERLLRWVETDKARLFRVDSVRLDRIKQTGGEARRYQMQLVVTGVFS
jgi:Tfp pilus assembly protein PilO